MKVTVCDRCESRIEYEDAELQITELDEDGGERPWLIKIDVKMMWNTEKKVSVDLCWNCLDVLRSM